MRRTLCSFAVAASLAVTSLASAQPAPNPEAVKHFVEGKRLRDEGKCELAIKELEASAKIEESIGARYNLGVCYEKSNKRLAYANYERALALAKEKQDDREREIAAQRYAFLKANPPVRLALPQPLPPDTHVTVDGESVPPEDLQGETIFFPKVERDSYDVRVTAPGYDDVRISIDKSATQKNSLFTVPMKKHQDTTAPPPPRQVETKWGPFQFLGLGLIALGAAGMTYAAVSALSYNQRKNNFFDRHAGAQNDLDKCNKRIPDQDCTQEASVEKSTRDDYDNNEQDARDKTPLWLTAGIGGVLAVGGGIVLIVFGPRDEVEPSTPAKGSLHIVPVIGARQSGLSLVGTF